MSSRARYCFRLEPQAISSQANRSRGETAKRRRCCRQDLCWRIGSFQISTKTRESEAEIVRLHGWSLATRSIRLKGSTLVVGMVSMVRKFHMISAISWSIRW